MVCGTGDRFTPATALPLADSWPIRNDLHQININFGFARYTLTSYATIPSSYVAGIISRGTIGTSVRLNEVLLTKLSCYFRTQQQERRDSLRQ